MRDFIPSDYVDKEGNVYETIGENIREGKNGSSSSEITSIGQLDPNPISDSNYYSLVEINGSCEWRKNVLNVETYKASEGNLVSAKGVYDFVESRVPRVTTSDYVIFAYINKLPKFYSPVEDIDQNFYFNTPPKTSAVFNFVNNRIPKQTENNTTQALMAYNGTPRWAGIKTSNNLFKNDLTTLVTVGSVASWVESFYPYANSSSNNATIISVIYDTESDTYTMEELADNPDKITISSSGGFISSTDSHKSVFDLHPISTTNTRLNSAPITKGFTSYGTMMVGWNIKMNYKAVVISGTKREG